MSWSPCFPRSPVAYGLCRPLTGAAVSELTDCQRPAPCPWSCPSRRWRRGAPGTQDSSAQVAVPPPRGPRQQIAHLGQHFSVPPEHRVAKAEGSNWVLESTQKKLSCVEPEKRSCVPVRRLRLWFNRNGSHRLFTIGPTGDYSHAGTTVAPPSTTRCNPWSRWSGSPPGDHSDFALLRRARFAMYSPKRPLISDWRRLR